MVDDGTHGSTGTFDGGYLGDELAHLHPALQLAVSSESPHDGINQVDLAENSAELTKPLLRYPIGLEVEKKAEQLGTGGSWLAAGC